jgi:hypothetical protein
LCLTLHVCPRLGMHFITSKGVKIPQPLEMFVKMCACLGISGFSGLTGSFQYSTYGWYLTNGPDVYVFEVQLYISRSYDLDHTRTLLVLTLPVKKKETGRRKYLRSSGDISTIFSYMSLSPTLSQQEIIICRCEKISSVPIRWFVLLCMPFFFWGCQKNAEDRSVFI